MEGRWLVHPPAWGGLRATSLRATERRQNVLRRRRVAPAGGKRSEARATTTGAVDGGSGRESRGRNRAYGCRCPSGCRTRRRDRLTFLTPPARGGLGSGAGLPPQLGSRVAKGLEIELRTLG